MTDHAELPTYDEVLEDLRDFRAEYFKARTRGNTGVMQALSSNAIDRAIAHLKSDPAEAMAEDYARRMDGAAATWDEEASSSVYHDSYRNHLRGKAEGLRDGARMLRDKDDR